MRFEEGIMTKHTEGSWRVEWSDSAADGSASFTIMKSDGDADDDGRMVDASYSIIEDAFPVLDDEENRANANLIAAAPDLYDALGALVTEVTRGHTQGHDERRLRTLAQRADMVLAYARGESYRFDDDEEWGPDSAAQQLERGPR
jgi:hypothetical protein